ncbi:MAG: helix-turn-helix domain-containing protein [Arcobacter butzleri]|jgi:predicted DNA-binding transcriptional regulator AlpA|nr:hypothetical protein [Arcobacteraceae bacterium]NLO16830.1 helix-turn-helix domain-containing protein [Aliarcobacter butzleri]
MNINEKQHTLIHEEDRLLKIEDVLEYIPVSKQHWYNLVKTGKAPKQIKFGTSSFWKYSDIQKLIQQGI